MRTAYAVLGIAWLVIIADGVYAFNHRFIKSGDTEPTIISTSSPIMATSTLTLTSPAFGPNTRIPSTFTCDGDREVSPPLSISGVPEHTKSLTLIMDDPDVPKALKPTGVFDHWVLFNIPAATKEIPEGLPAQAGGSIGVTGANGAGANAFTGPCPPPQYEPSEHRYFFKLYALDEMLPLHEGASKANVESAMKGHILAQTELIGRYKRQ